MDREERLALGLVVMSLVAQALASGCRAPASASSWALDGGLGERELRMDPASWCAPETWPAIPAELRGTCAPRLEECLALSEYAGECYDAQPGECAECVEHALYECATTLGACDDELGAIACCREAECPEGGGECLQRALLPGGRCAPIVERFEECARESARAGGPCERYRDACGPTAAQCYGRAETRWRMEPALSVHARFAHAEAYAGALRLLLSEAPPDEPRLGERMLLLELREAERVRCAIVERRPEHLAAVRELHCEIEIDERWAASESGVCDGWIAGAFRAVSAEGLVEGRFEAPLAVSEPDLAGEVIGS